MTQKKTTVDQFVCSNSPHQSQQAQLESYRIAFMHSPAMMGIWNWEDSQYVLVNDSFLELTGYSREEVIGKTVEDLHILEPSSQRQIIRNLLEEKGRCDNIEICLKTKDGRCRFVLFSTEIAELSGRKVCISIARDITEQKQTERMLALQYELALALGVTSDMPTALKQIISAAMRVGDVSGVLIYHYNEENDLLQLLAQQGLPQELSDFAQYIRKPSIMYADFIKGKIVVYDVTKPDPSYEPLVFSYWQTAGIKTVVAVPVRHLGKLVAAMTIELKEQLKENDIGVQILEGMALQIGAVLARLHDEAQIRQNEEHNRLLLEQIPALFWTVDAELRVTSAAGRGLSFSNSNLAAEKNISLAELANYYPLPPSTVDQHQRALRGELINLEVKHQGRTISTHLRPLLGPHNEIIGVLGFCFDLTEYQQAKEDLTRRNEELIQLNAQREEINRTKDQFVAMLSHELRTPLVTGIGYVEMMMHGALGQISETGVTRMQIAYRNLQRLNILIDNVLRYRGLIEIDLTRKPNPTTINVVEVCQEIVKGFIQRHEYPPEQVKFLCTEQSIAAQGDRDLVQLALDNLFDEIFQRIIFATGVFLKIEKNNSHQVRIVVGDEKALALGDKFIAEYLAIATGEGEDEDQSLSMKMARSVLARHQTPLEEAIISPVGIRFTFTLPVSSTNSRGGHHGSSR